MICNKVPDKSHTHKLPPTTVLLDTSTSVSLMPSWQAKALNVEVKPRMDIVIRGADGQPLVVEGVGEVWALDPLATYWKKVKVVVTRDGSLTLISPSDQNRLLLLEPSYPRFLGTGKYRRSNARGSPKKDSNTDSGISGSYKPIFTYSYCNRLGVIYSTRIEFRHSV